jgi:hypothetical protein
MSHICHKSSDVLLLPVADVNREQFGHIAQVAASATQKYIIKLRSISNTLASFTRDKRYTHISMQFCGSPHHSTPGLIRQLWLLAAAAPSSPHLSKGREVQHRFRCHASPTTRDACGCPHPHCRSCLRRDWSQQHLSYFRASLLFLGSQRKTESARHAARSCEDHPLRHSRPGVQLQRPRKQGVCRPAPPGCRPQGSQVDERA